MKTLCSLRFPECLVLGVLADSVFLDREGDMFSSRPQEEAIALVSEIGVAALNSMVCGATDASTVPPAYVVATTPSEDASDLDIWISWLNV